MNNLKSYFASPVKSEGPSSATAVLTTFAADSTTSIPLIVKSPRPNSKLILQNMEEVLNSVKKKHRQKHRRKKEQKRKELLEGNGNTTENNSKSSSEGQSPETPKNQKTPLKESTSQTSTKVTRKVVKNVSAPDFRSPTKTPSILDHFQRTPVKNGSTPVQDTPTTSTGAVSDKSAKPNAFEMMMNARNKSIGSNTPGKDAPSTPKAEDNVATGKQTAKRKLLLQEWADKKGAVKRKIDDDVRCEYIEQQMDKRAKRFKNMLVNGGDKTESQSVQPIEEDPSKKKPLKKRIKRLPSNISVESTENNASDVEFAQKLASPIKKRDSLLGYFPKMNSPEESEEKVDTPKVRGRGKGRKAVAVAAEEVDTPTSASRPRRSCAGQTRYDIDLEKTPTKSTPSRREPRKGKSKLVAATIEEEDEVIQVDDVSQTPKKLAPLFVRSMPRPTMDPDTLRAKQKFLMSGVPEKMRIEITKQKQSEQMYEFPSEYFPKTSHVRQWSEAELASRDVDLSVVCSFRTDDASEEVISPSRRMKKRTFTECKPKDFRAAYKPKPPRVFEPLPAVENKRDVVKEWKIQYEKFPTYKCYNQLREKYRYFCAIDATLNTEQVTESFVVTRQTRQNKKELKPDDEEEKPPVSAPNGELLFTEKYKPMLSEQVLVNLAPVNALKEFLATWQNGNGRKPNDSMMDEYFANDSNSSCSALSNSIVLLGTKSSGKSAAVFALANEMNFNVLEINAGMKRTGKKLLSELQEATQSQTIAKDRKGALKRSISGPKRKASDASESNSSSEISSSSKMSLILVEDADVIFDQHDAGFVDAIYTLAATSKRPVIICANNSNCPHLQRLIKQNSITFNPPNVINISKFLSILALVENCPMELNDLVSLYLYNRKDLRRTILEMQIFIQSGGDKVYPKKELARTSFFASPVKRQLSTDSETPNQDDNEVTLKSSLPPHAVGNLYLHKNMFDFFTVSQNFMHRVPFPVDFELLSVNLKDIFQASKRLGESDAPFTKRRTRKSRSPRKPKLCLDDKVETPLDVLCDFYENISMASSWQSVDIADRLCPDLTEDISHYMVESAIATNLNPAACPYNLFDTPKECTNLTPYMSTQNLKTNTVLFLDYEPVLRSICRSEKARSQVERRGSRFYHYLRNSSNNLNTFSTALFDSTCTIFSDEVPSNDQQ